MKNNNKIDIIIPAYKAQKTILRTLSSIAEQTILKDIEVTIVNDDCPKGDYQKYVKMFSPYMKIREIKMDKNGEPGKARQFGIDNTENEFFTCIDADDTFCGAIALEILREGISASPVIKCCSGSFYQLGEDLMHIVPHQHDMVWMFGKLYRREFIEHYGIHFNDTRANEDTGFNKWVELLCNNEREQIRYMDEFVYYWHNKKNSITRINDGQYGFDQCFCGWTDNMIYAIEHAREKRPFDGNITQFVVTIMIQLYFYYIQCVARMPVFKDQNYEYVKKYYHTCYKELADKVPDEAFSEIFSYISMQENSKGSMIGIIPPIGIKEFMDELEKSTYDPDDIYDIWEEMKEDEDTKKLFKNNEKCGVCAEGYTNRPTY